MTRTWFCPICKEKQRPTNGDIFILIGQSGLIKVRRILKHTICRPKHYGFTPHLTMLDKVVRNKRQVKLLVTCCIAGCGIYVGKKGVDGKYPVDIIKTHKKVLSLNDWISLKAFTKNGLYIGE